jgi:hypothetical protein
VLARRRESALAPTASVRTAAARGAPRRGRRSRREGRRTGHFAVFQGPPGRLGGACGSSGDSRVSGRTAWAI